MNRWLVIASIIFFNLQSFAQRDTGSYFFDEFNVSINRTFFLTEEHHGTRTGFGFGLYCSEMKKKKINLTFGFEYNLTRQFIDRTEEHIGYAANLIYSIHNISAPFYIRFNFGSKTKIFIDTGSFLDILAYARRKGTKHTYDFNGQNKEYEIKGKADLVTVNYGFSLGLGVRIPVSKFELIIKPDYKLGLHQLDKPYQDAKIFNSYIRLTIGVKNTPYTSPHL